MNTVKSYFLFPCGTVCVSRGTLYETYNFYSVCVVGCLDGYMVGCVYA